ncbi:ABC transporter permease [Natronobeatus ordinarius]|uniref:ABC transporter permease n=1 Tax=Natronobeatus ordinarius TaxID=2963433 RepID=UPI0020CF4B33|nr:ABC transporter permease [Natronobeatus ordinarius]
MSRFRGAVGLGLRGVGYRRERTLLAIAGVALAVLSITLLAGVGVGVLETGEESFDSADRDLWIDGGPIALSPADVGGVRPTLTDAHQTADEIAAHDDVSAAVPMGFQTVFVGTDEDDFDRLLAVGVSGGGSALSLQEGEGFSDSDTHYANGTYGGPMSHEVIVDPETAARYDLEVGDQLHVGGTTSNARANEFTVVGISSSLDEFTGGETVVLYLSELQTLTGTSGTDEATFITVTVEDDADVAAVQAELQETYPELDVRTNREQLEEILGDQLLVIAAGITLAVLAVTGGAVLLVTLLTLSIHHQRQEFAALRAIGVSRSTIATIAATQGFSYALLGGIVGVLATPVCAAALDALASELTGFDDLVRVDTTILLVGFGLATTIGVVAGLYAAWRVTRVPALHVLTR